MAQQTAVVTRVMQHREIATVAALARLRNDSVADHNNDPTQQMQRTGRKFS